MEVFELVVKFGTVRPFMSQKLIDDEGLAKSKLKGVGGSVFTLPVMPFMFFAGRGSLSM